MLDKILTKVYYYIVIKREELKWARQFTLIWTALFMIYMV